MSESKWTPDPPKKKESEPVAADPLPSAPAVSSTISTPHAVIYDGAPRPSAALKEFFPQGHVEMYQSRRADGTAFYDVRNGQPAFFPESGNGKAFFAGEEVK